MKIQCTTPDGTYPILIERGALNKISQYIKPHHTTCILTDTGVPEKWVRKVQQSIPASFVVTIPQGEGSKNLETFGKVLEEMATHHMNRGDAIVAAGGGVVGDLAGFCAASYMRGIDFYNIPTTLLAQVDSSVGGKTAIDLGTWKNLVGAFWQPKAVLIDPDVLTTLPARQISNGLAEALKMGLILDASLVDLFEQTPLPIDQIIARSIELKRTIVQQDEKEQGKRALLNFGHTIGHAIEGASGLDTYLHGECVARGMLYFIDNDQLKKRVHTICQTIGLPDIPPGDKETLMDYIRHDKKGASSTIKTVHVSEPGKSEIIPMTYEEIEALL